MPRTNAILLVLCGALFLSFAGVLLRQIEDASSIQVLIYRSFSLACIIPFIASWRRSERLSAFHGSLDRGDVFMGVLMAASFSFYIYSILNTTVASTLFILAASPFMAAIIGWAWIGERPKASTWITMIVALGGVALMVWDGLGSGRTLGNIFALLAGLTFALSLVYTRRSKREDMLGAVFLGGLMSSGFNLVLAIVLGQSVILSLPDASISLVSGVCTIGIGMALIIWGATHLPAAEVSILALIESVAGPLWVWLAYNEQASPALMAGGAIVLVAVSLQAWLSRPRKRVGVAGISVGSAEKAVSVPKRFD